MVHKIGTYLKEAREKTGRTQEQLAKDMGVTLKTVKNWEQNVVHPTLDTLLILCDLYLCDLNYLTGRRDFSTFSMQEMHEYTGLSEKALTTLHNWKNKTGVARLGFSVLPGYLSKLIENKSFASVLSAVEDYDIAPDKKEMENLIFIDSGDQLAGLKEMRLWNAARLFSQCLEKTFERKKGKC